MGLFWGSKTSATPKSTAEDSTAQDSSIPPSQTPAPPSTPIKPAPAPQASDDDAEVRRFLQEVMGEVNSMRKPDQAGSSSTSSNQSTRPPNPLSAWASRWSSSTSSSSTSSTDDFFTTDHDHDHDDNPNNEPRLSPLAESLLPTTMDCEQAFNQAFYCQSLGGQWHHLYRYGSVRSCSEQWDDWFFCMRAKGTPPGRVKENMIRDHYRRKLLAKYGPGKPSSEDVWRERRERVPPGEAFATQVEAPQVSDAEYQKWEMERMERIRKGLSET